MDHLFRWIAKHQRVVRFSLALALGCCLGIVRIKTGMSVFLTVALVLWGAILVSLAVNYSFMRFQKRALKIMTDQCDPDPFLHEMQTQVSYDLTPILDTMLRINLALAHYHKGSVQIAMDIMKHIPYDQKRKTNIAIKTIYYNNLSVFLTDLGDYDGAEEAYGHFMELVNGKIRKAFVKQYPNTIPMAEAEHLYRTGEYAAALEKANETHPTHTQGKVETALFRARCAIALGAHNAARQDLNYVIENGNKLAAVDKAWELLMKL